MTTFCLTDNHQLDAPRESVELNLGAGQDGKVPGLQENQRRWCSSTARAWMAGRRPTFTRPARSRSTMARSSCPPGRSMTGITCTRPNLPTTNYEFSYEAMRIDGRDFFAAATFPVGKSFITLVNGGWGGNVTGLSSLDGMDASENETTQSFRYQNKTWYHFRIRVTGKMIRCCDRRQGNRRRESSGPARRDADRDPPQPAAGIRHLGNLWRGPQHRNPAPHGCRDRRDRQVRSMT